MENTIKKKYNEIISKFVRDKLYLNTYTALTDNTHMEIENCKKIIEYNDIYIKIQTATITISIWGQDLKISDYNTDGIIIDGIFSSIEFE